MSRELDLRRSAARREARAGGLEPPRDQSPAGSGLPPGDQSVEILDVDPLTQNPSRVAFRDLPVEEDGRFVQRALDRLQRSAKVLGLADGQPPEFIMDPQPQTTSSGSVAVHFHQQYKGLPILQGEGTARFSPGGSLTEMTGTIVSVAEDLPVSAELSVQDAVSLAVQHVATPDEDDPTHDQFGTALATPRVDVEHFEAEIVAAFGGKAERPTVLARGPFGAELKASLMWFPLDGTLRLSWEVLIAMPEDAGQYRTLVDANTGEILYCKQLMRSIAALGRVYATNGGEERRLMPFPRPKEDYGLRLPTNLPLGFPDDWVESNASTSNLMTAHVGSEGRPVLADISSGTPIFDPSDIDGDEQRVLNLFYYVNLMHDITYILGFREENGNFQQDNFGRGGVAGNRIDARVHPGPVWATANFVAPADGTVPVMNMGLVAATNRHTALDSTVVFHEFMHGVTDHLVGGLVNVRALDNPQSAGIAEGLGDYMACTLTGSPVIAAWVVDNPWGIRRFAYDQFPSGTDNFGNLGRGRYGDADLHNIGEIWCAALLEVNRRIGARLALQLVFDALKLAKPNPSFLDLRDAMLLALDDQVDAGQVEVSSGAQARSGIWEAFAKFGMGRSARTRGSFLAGIEAGFDLPGGATSTDVTDAVRVRENGYSIALESSQTRPLAAERVDGAIAPDRGEGVPMGVFGLGEGSDHGTHSFHYRIELLQGES